MRAASPVLALALLSSLSLPVAARAQTSALDAVLNCLSVPDGPDRLACFNSRVPALRGPGPAAPAATAAPAVQGLGAEQLARPRAEAAPEQEVKATIAALRQNAEGRMVFTLDNGQVWLQRDSASVRLKAGDVVTVKPGALGTYNLIGGGSGLIIKVRRVK
ncbi:hypothetical protein [Oleisolibacter albus]|uniref:hypothetical protein n=1 Tax=Oleisolibacter albus TaxID=2171757 RepID=UPI000DF3634C|nr:hypothetical protein [Oleisolibacter albus]